MEDNKIHSFKYLRKSIRRNCCSFLVLFVVHFLVLTAAAFGFYYIEHCLQQQQVSNDNEVEQQKSNNTAIDSSSNSLHQNNTIYNSTRIESEVVWKKTCEIKRAYVFMWLEYSMTVATTIGW